MSRKINEMVDNLCMSEGSIGEEIASNIFIDIFKAISKFSFDETFRHVHNEFLAKNISKFN